ncbi:MAG: hypothetical protein VYA50_00670 [Chloroflexota bacterium]|nr:hypothetical protein [Chloroflexota bacterium]
MKSPVILSIAKFHCALINPNDELARVLVGTSKLERGARPLETPS